MKGLTGAIRSNSYLPRVAVRQILGQPDDLAINLGQQTIEVGLICAQQPREGG